MTRDVQSSGLTGLFPHSGGSPVFEESLPARGRGAGGSAAKEG